MEIKIIVRWNTRDKEAIAAIRKRFGFPDYTTVNGWTPAMLRPDDRVMLDECARRGFLSYQEKEWAFNGKSYSW